MADERQSKDIVGDESFWKRSKRALGGKSFTFLQHEPKSSKDGSQGGPESDAKAAHSRRREQVRRAQRNHRERKEKYIKTLEREVLRLKDEEVNIAESSKIMREEISMLRSLLEIHKIPLPLAPSSPNAIVSVQQLQFGQGLHVEMPSSGTFAYSSTSPYSGSDTTPVVIRPYEKELPSLPQSQPTQVNSDLDIDSSQAGIDFVLTLEQPCLGHTRPTDDSEDGPPSGHALTAQAILLTRAPETLGPNCNWQVPAIEIDRLLELSSGLNLLGELTPVQAWTRIRSYPSVRSLPDAKQRLTVLTERLQAEVHCYEFGAVVDEVIFEAHLHDVFNGPSIH